MFHLNVKYERRPLGYSARSASVGFTLEAP
jgi:hypothetical protein